jgi:hypothetical protein
MRERYIMTKDGLVPRDEFFANLRETPRGPTIIGDMAETRSMLDGKVYSSKRHYRDHVKAHGCEIVGNDFNNQPMTREADIAPRLSEDIARAIAETS